MTWSDAAIQGMLQRLAAGWTSQSSLPLNFVECWKEKVGDRVKVRDADHNLLYFTADLGKVHLRGTEEVHCLLVSGDCDATRVRDHYNKVIAPGRLVFVLCASSAVSEALAKMTGTPRCMILNSVELAEVITATVPLQAIKRLLAAKIERRSLIPFSILLTAQGNMFYGRSDELERLISEDEATFAVAGPSRIGKTSLVKEYIQALVRRSHYLSNATFYIDCYECADLSDEGLTHFLAMRMDGSSYANRVQLKDFPQFLRFIRSRIGQAPNIVIDESDEICDTEVMRQLSTLSKNGHCRVVFCGRGKLLQAALDPKSALGGRLELMRLKPLDETSVRRLFFDPLQDLGITVTEPEEVIGRVLRWTGCLPHLVQFFGQRLCELALKEKTATIEPAQIENLKWDFETAQYFTSPLADVTSLHGKLIALLVLKKQPKTVTYAYVIEIAREHGVSLSIGDAQRICNDLLICNILVWGGESSLCFRDDEQGGRLANPASYRISTEALCEYAEKLGFLTQGLLEVKNQIHKVPAPKAS